MKRINDTVRYISAALFAAITMVVLLPVSTVQAAVFDVYDTVPDGAPGSLRHAVAQANLTPEEDRIRVHAGHYVLDSESGEIEITGTMNIVGEGASVTIIDGNSGSRVFKVTGPITATIKDLEITGGYVYDSPGEPAEGGGLFI